MNPRIKAMWIEALCSGEYKQAKDALHPADGFCCLGVLCDLYIRERCINWAGSEWRGIMRGHEDENLPPEVQEWAGLADAETENPDPLGLSMKNDDGVPFSEIATLIEEGL